MPRYFQTISQTIPLKISLFCLCSLTSGLGVAQVGHGGHHQAADITGIAAQTETIPGHDTVLAMAPQQLELHFPVAVRLVKLTLRNEQRDWVDIDFRYDPRPGIHYHWNIPALSEAVYYTVDWAALDRNDRLVRGSFDFAFGTEARAPSETRAEQELLLQQRYGDPEIRYVAPPRTQIIIDRDPPRFDPPFTINLNDPDPDNPDN